MTLIRPCCKNKMVTIYSNDATIWLYCLFVCVKILCRYEYKNYGKTPSLKKNMCLKCTEIKIPNKSAVSNLILKRQNNSKKKRRQLFCYSAFKNRQTLYTGLDDANEDCFKNISYLLFPGKCYTFECCYIFCLLIV